MNEPHPHSYTGLGGLPGSRGQSTAIVSNLKAEQTHPILPRGDVAPRQDCGAGREPVRVTHGHDVRRARVRSPAAPDGRGGRGVAGDGGVAFGGGAAGVENNNG